MPRAALLAAAAIVPLALIAGCTNTVADATVTQPAQAAANHPSGTATSAPTASQRPLGPAGQLWNQTEDNAEQATSVHVTAQLIDGRNKVAVDLAATKEHQAIGQLTLSGNHLVIRRTGKTLYFKADAGFWKAFGDKKTAKKFTNKWIKVTKGSTAMEPIFELTELNYFTDQALSLPVSSKQNLLVIPGPAIAGQKTTGLADMPAGKQTAQSGTLFVTASTPTLPLAWKVGTDGRQYINFDRWNTAVKVAVPKGSFDLDPYLKK
jgi:hypothetical protein